MTMLKLADSDGSILGAIIIPDEKVPYLFRERHLALRWVDSPAVSWKPDPTLGVANIHTIVIVDHPGRADAVMIAQGNLWNFEKIPGCFFIPGYDFTMKGRR